MLINFKEIESNNRDVKKQRDLDQHIENMHAFIKGPNRILLRQATLNNLKMNSGYIKAEDYHIQTINLVSKDLLNDHKRRLLEKYNIH